jgi:hypothetical protein
MRWWWWQLRAFWNWGGSILIILAIAAFLLWQYMPQIRAAIP